MAASDPNAASAAKDRRTVTCPWCGRTVETFNHPDQGRVMLGHRIEQPHVPETPWCEGGGRNAD